MFPCLSGCPPELAASRRHTGRPLQFAALAGRSLLERSILHEHTKAAEELHDTRHLDQRLASLQLYPCHSGNLRSTMLSSTFAVALPKRRSARLYPLPAACRRLLRLILGCYCTRLCRDCGLLSLSRERRFPPLWLRDSRFSLLPSCRCCRLRLFVLQTASMSAPPAAVCRRPGRPSGVQELRLAAVQRHLQRPRPLLQVGHRAAPSFDGQDSRGLPAAQSVSCFIMRSRPLGERKDIKPDTRGVLHEAGKRTAV